MPIDFKRHTPEKTIKENINSTSSAIDSYADLMEKDEITTAFRDLHVSALSKAANISPNVNSVTLGAKSVIQNEESCENEETDCDYVPTDTQSSTPKTRINHIKKLQEFVRLKQKEKNVTSHKKINLENGISYQKLLSELDNQRRLTVDKVMRERIQNMLETKKAIRENLEHEKQIRQEESITRRILLERKILDDIREQEILNKPKREAEWAEDNLKEAQRIQERNQRVKEAEEEARKKSEIISLKIKQIEQIHSYLLKEYDEEHKCIIETMKSYKEKTGFSDLLATQSKILKDLLATREKIIKNCKQGDVSEQDVESSKNLVETIKITREEFMKEMEERKKRKIEEEIRVQKEELARKKEMEQKKTQESSTATSTATSTPVATAASTTTSTVTSASTPAIKSDLSDCFDARSIETYVNLKNILETWEKNIEPLLSDESMKKFRFNCQKAVNIPVNAISPVSGPHLSEKYLKLHNLLSGRTVEVGDVKITATQHPLGTAYCKYVLAKKLVDQGDLTVSSKSDAAFSIAAVLASLWVDFPDFGQLVLAQFQTACPYLAPVFLPQVEGQSDEEYHKSLGYHYSQNGEIEKQDRFLKRMSGIMRLYAAVLISNVRQPGKMNPLGLSEGWRWISALLNLEPRPDICATLLYDFLEVAGHEMFRAYGGQFKKMLAYICQEYFPKLEKVTPSSAGGPMARLEGFLQKILKEESIPPPNGVLPPNFW